MDDDDELLLFFFVSRTGSGHLGRGIVIIFLVLDPRLYSALLYAALKEKMEMGKEQDKSV